jgi:hypothetical protein
MGNLREKAEGKREKGFCLSLLPFPLSPVNRPRFPAYLGA